MHHENFEEKVTGKLRECIFDSQNVRASRAIRWVFGLQPIYAHTTPFHSVSKISEKCLKDKLAP